MVHRPAARSARAAARPWRIGLFFALCAAAAGVLAQSPPSSAEALKLRVVGGLAGVSQYVRHEEPFWTRELSRLSDGRFSADIVPFDRAGVPGYDMLTLLRLGVVPFGTALLNQVAGQYPELSAPDLAGLNPDVPTLRKVVSAFRPALEGMMAERHGAKLLAIYMYPAQVVFCREALKGAKDLAARKVRVSSATQSDFVRALGAEPVVIPFSEVGEAMRSGMADCAITGAVSGNAVGLPKVANTLYTLPISWGLAAFAANQEAWRALPAELQSLLLAQLPRLESAIWDEAERDSLPRRSCTAAQPCVAGTLEALTEVRPLDADQALRRRIFEQEVLPRWIDRCGPKCPPLWDATIAPVVGVKAPPYR